LILGGFLFVAAALQQIKIPQNHFAWSPKAKSLL
jgi:hypothetical protein